MTDQTFFISRTALSNVFDDPMVVRQFETMQDRVANTEDSLTASVAETDALKDATFVTLSANAELPNERVLAAGDGISISATSEGLVKIAAKVYADSAVKFTTIGSTALALPPVGTLATRSGQETFENKTLDAPSLSNLGDYSDDTAASAGGVPVGGVYRNGSAVQVRVS